MKKQQQGSTAVIALCIMICLTLVAAGVVPMVTNQIKFSEMNADSIEAQIVAEAGAKRAIVDLSRGTNLSWSGIIPQRMLGDKNSTYMVTIAPTDDLKYTITSIGAVNDARRTVTVDIITSPPWAIRSGRYFIIESVDGSKVTVHGSISASTIYGEDKLAKESSYHVVPFDPNKPILPNYPSAATLATYTTYPLPYDSTGVCTEKNYYVKGNLQTGGVIDAGGNNITIYVDGAITISPDDSNIIKNGKVRFVAQKGINVHNGNLQDVVLCSYGDITINTDQDFKVSLTGAILANGNIKVTRDTMITANTDTWNAFYDDEVGKVTVSNWNYM